MNHTKQRIGPIFMRNQLQDFIWNWDKLADGVKKKLYEIFHRKIESSNPLFSVQSV